MRIAICHRLGRTALSRQTAKESTLVETLAAARKTPLLLISHIAVNKPLSTLANDGDLHKSLSSQEHGAQAECKQLNLNLHLPPSPGPISPVSPSPADATPKREGASKHANSDPITVTPSSQRNRKE